MDYQWILTGLIVLVILEVFFSKIIFSVISWIVKIPILVLDYYILYLFWSKDGQFNKIWILVFFLVYLLIFSGLLWWLRKHRRLRMLIINTIVFIVPVISILTTNWLASFMKVDNRVTFELLDKFVK